MIQMVLAKSCLHTRENELGAQNGGSSMCVSEDGPHQAVLGPPGPGYKVLKLNPDPII